MWIAITSGGKQNVGACESICLDDSHKEALFYRRGRCTVDGEILVSQ
jgi:hypothetical protein